MSTPAAEQTPQEGASKSSSANPREGAGQLQLHCEIHGWMLHPCTALGPPEPALGKGMGHRPPLCHHSTHP